MTRHHNTQFHCPNCKTWHTSETIFGRWIRNNKQLDSSEGFCVIDQDYWIHRFKHYDDRDFQLIMLVEIKTNSADLTDAQRDTLHIANQIMRNRSWTPTKQLKHQPDLSVVRKVRSIKNKKFINVRVYGVHCLRFSHLGPDDSDWIIWDHNQIDQETLTQLLRFDLDPDTLKPIDLRNHHINPKKHQLSLFQSESKQASGQLGA
jgi:hypothetical protein